MASVCLTNVLFEKRAPVALSNHDLISSKVSRVAVSLQDIQKYVLAMHRKGISQRKAVKTGASARPSAADGEELLLFFGTRRDFGSSLTFRSK